MTTNIIIQAHVSDEKEVDVCVFDNGEMIEGFKLQDGENAERLVYDGRSILVKERTKGQCCHNCDGCRKLSFYFCANCGRQLRTTPRY